MESSRLWAWECMVWDSVDDKVIEVQKVKGLRSKNSGRTVQIIMIITKDYAWSWVGKSNGGPCTKTFGNVKVGNQGGITA